MNGGQAYHWAKPPVCWLCLLSSREKPNLKLPPPPISICWRHFRLGIVTVFLVRNTLHQLLQLIRSHCLQTNEKCCRCTCPVLLTPRSINPPGGVGGTTRTTSPSITPAIHSIYFSPPNTPFSFLFSLLPCLINCTYRITPLSQCLRWTTLSKANACKHHVCNDPGHYRSWTVAADLVHRQPRWEDQNQFQSPKPRGLSTNTQGLYCP